MKYLFILNDAPYGSERSYNGLRLARQLLKDPAAANEVRVFLVGDAAACGQAGQKVPEGYYNVEAMLAAIASRGSPVGICGTCMDARGIAEERLVPGCRRSNLAEQAAWAAWADKVLVF